LGKVDYSMTEKKKKSRQFSRSLYVAKDIKKSEIIMEEQGVKYYILVEPKGNFAEVYKLVDGYYKLDGEFTIETYSFEIDNYKIEFNFENIF